MTEFHPFNIAVTLGMVSPRVAVPHFESNEVYLIQPIGTDRKVTKVKVGTGPSAVVYSESFLYVANTGSNDVSVIDSKTNQIVNTVKVGTAPSGIAYYPNIHNIYVANSGSNDVTVIHEDPGAGVREGLVTEWPIFATKKVGTAPSSVAYNPDNNLVYVANSGSNDVSIIRNYNVDTTVKVGTAPSCIAGPLAGYSGNVYVANSGSNDVSVIDSKTNQIVNTVRVGTGPSAIVSVVGVVCVANSGSNNISVIDVEKNAVVYTIQASKPFSFGSESDNYAYGDAYACLVAGIPMKLYHLDSKTLEDPIPQGLLEYPISNFTMIEIDY